MQSAFQATEKGRVVSWGYSLLLNTNTDPEGRRSTGTGHSIGTGQSVSYLHCSIQTDFSRKSFEGWIAGCNQCNGDMDYSGSGTRPTRWLHKVDKVGPLICPAEESMQPLERIYLNTTCIQW